MHGIATRVVKGMTLFNWLLYKVVLLVGIYVVSILPPFVVAIDKLTQFAHQRFRKRTGSYECRH